MDPIKIEFTPEQRAQVEPLLKRVEELNGLGVFCMTAGLVFSDGMVIGIVSGERAHELNRETGVSHEPVAILAVEHSKS